MKKLLLSFLTLCLGTGLYAQTYTYVPIDSLVFVDSTKLANCVDSNAYWGDTITTRGIVITDGNLSEVSSSSVTGGSRPFISIQHLDTATNTAIYGPWTSVVVMGVEAGTSNPNTDIENAIAGDVIEITGIVNVFNGLIQLQPISSTAVTLQGFTSIVNPTVISAGTIQDNQRINVLETGEAYEGSYVELQNVTVVSVSIFSSGSRIEFTVEDSLGNQVLVADRFLPMRLAGISTVNPNSPDSVGSLIAPSVGATFNHIRGIIFQDQNGCAGGGSFAGGYEINPFDSTDFDQAASPPNISDVRRSVLTPKDTQSVVVSAEIIDFDGTVTSATLFYTADQTAPTGLFSSIAMTNTSGDTYEATIPAFGLDSLVRYFIEAIDDSSQTTNTEVLFYTVRANGTTIMDIQSVPAFLSGDASPLEGDSVSVTGVVTASFQAGDLGFLYIQDPNATEYAGIYVDGGPVSRFNLNRGDSVRVSGTVTEAFGFTKIDAVTIDSIAAVNAIMPITVNPSDTSLFTLSNRSNMEKYESMLLSYQNPALGGRVNVSSVLSFGEYTVGSGSGANVSARILAGRSQNGSAQGSLDVSYISDTAAYGAGLNVTPIQVDTSFSMDNVDGILFYAFGNYKLTPRNNADFGNVLVSIEEIEGTEVGVTLFPNPSSDRINIQIDETYQFEQLNIQLFDITSRVVIDTRTAVSFTTLPVSQLERGVYILRITDANDLIHSAKLIVE